MSDVEKATASPAAAFVDDIWSAASETRTTAKWIASGLGALPSLAIIGAIVRAPGDNGWDATELAVGVGLAAAGALLGILAFAKVLTPVGVEDSVLLADPEPVAMGRIPGNGHATYKNLLDELEGDRAAVAHLEGEAKDHASAAADAKAEVQEADVKVKSLGADVLRETDPAKKTELQQQLRSAEGDLAQAKADSEAAAAKSGRTDRQLAEWTTKFNRRSTLKAQVHQLYAADVIRRRFEDAKLGAFWSVALVAAGVVFLGLAPIEKQPEAPPAPSLVTLTVNRAGRDALGCPDAKKLQAIRVGGDDETPLVITLPDESCPAKTIKFKTEEKAPFGTVTPVKAVPAE